MPAVSKKQQRFFGMVRAAHKGEGAASPEVAKVASEISKEDAKKFAKTKHKGLPMKKEEMTYQEAIDAGWEMSGEGIWIPPQDVAEGDVHSGQGEKIQKRTKKWMDKKGQAGAPGLDAMKARTAEHKAKRGVKEEVLDELSKRTLGNYVKDASSDAAMKSMDHGNKPLAKDAPKREKKILKRLSGIRKATDKLSKEEITFGEWNSYFGNEPDIEGAIEYFYEEGINEEGIDQLIEEIGLETFIDFV